MPAGASVAQTVQHIGHSGAHAVDVAVRDGAELFCWNVQYGDFHGDANCCEQRALFTSQNDAARICPAALTASSPPVAAAENSLLKRNVDFDKNLVFSGEVAGSSSGRSLYPNAGRNMSMMDNAALGHLTDDELIPGLWHRIKNDKKLKEPSTIVMVDNKNAITNSTYFPFGYNIDVHCRSGPIHIQ